MGSGKKADALEYVLRLIAYYVKVQKLMKEKGIELEERYEQK